MDKNVQRGPFTSIVRAIYLLMQGRIHFPKDRLGEIVDGGEEFEIFRHMTLDPGQDQPEKPGAIFKVRFRFASMSPEMNRRTSFASAENYWTSFPMKLMKRRAVPESFSYEIESAQDSADVCRTPP